MFDLEKSIAEWRKQMLAAGIKTPVPLEELEIHLREEIERQTELGLDVQQAFDAALEKIGHANAQNAEFTKIFETTLMKTFNRRIAARIFCALIMLDAVLLVLQHLIPGTWQILPWWIVNAPGFLLAIVVGPLIPISALGLT